MSLVRESGSRKGRNGEGVECRRVLANAPSPLRPLRKPDSLAEPFHFFGTSKGRNSTKPPSKQRTTERRLYMRRSIVVALSACLGLTLFNLTADAFSDGIGVYARIDKIILEPNEAAPERIQIWGAFAVASRENRSSYDSPQRGYLYFTLKAGKEEVCRREWADLKTVAGTDQILGFGSRFTQGGRLRKKDESPAKPDEYPLGYGLVRMRDRGTEYGPIKELRALAKER